MADSNSFDFEREKKNEGFARCLRGFASHYLRRIAAGYMEAERLRTQLEEKQLVFSFIHDEILHDVLRKNQLSGFALNGRAMTYKQARVVHELIVLGKYGGYNRDNRPLGIIPLLKVIEESSSDFLRPEGYFPGKDYAVGRREI